MKLSVTAAMVYLLLFTGCSSTRIIHSWKAANVPEKKYTKILVVGLVPVADSLLRQKMENHLAGDLTEKGYMAISSLQEYAPAFFENIKEEDALSRLQGSGVDAVMTIVLLDKKRERYYVPYRVNYSPYSVSHNHFWRYYNTMHDRIYSPGYFQAETQYFWECNFYDPATKQLLYAVQTKSFDPGSAEVLADEFGKRIIKDMGSKGLLK